MVGFRLERSLRAVCTIGACAAAVLLLLSDGPASMQLRSPRVLTSDNPNSERTSYHFDTLTMRPPLIPAAFHQWMHDKFIAKPAAYYAQWEDVTGPGQPASHKWKWTGKDYPRVPCVLEFETYVKKHNIFAETILTADDTDPEIEMIPHNEVITLPYNPATEEGDLHTFQMERRDFDFVLLGQTLEHLYDPMLCLMNFFAHMKPGGYLFASVPTFNIPHSTPVHFQQYFPDGLAILMYRAGFEIIEVGQWGNRNYAGMMVDGYKWPDVNAMEKPIRNDAGFPVNTWVLVRKPLSGIPYFETNSPAELMAVE